MEACILEWICASQRLSLLSTSLVTDSLGASETILCWVSNSFFAPCTLVKHGGAFPIIDWLITLAHDLSRVCHADNEELLMDNILSHLKARHWTPHSYRTMSALRGSKTPIKLRSQGWRRVEISTYFAKLSHSKKKYPRNAPINILIMIYPLKYMASSITKYATANSNMWIVARTNCWSNVGLNSNVCIGRALSRLLGTLSAGDLGVDEEADL